MKEHEISVIEKMKSYAIEAIQFKDDITFEQFSLDRKTINACVFNISQIGELVSKLSSDFLEKNNFIPWRNMKYLRNKIVHDYDGVNLEVIWEILTIYLPELVSELKKVK